MILRTPEDSKSYHETIRSEEIKIRYFTFCFNFLFSDYETLFDQIKIQSFGTALKNLTSKVTFSILKTTPRELSEFK